VQRAPFLVTFGLKWLVYGVLISIVNLRSLGVLVLGLVAVAAPLPVSVALWSVAFSFAVAFAAPRTLGHLGFGRYHQPHLEDRFFLFVDIRGSTTLAERIGPIAVHRFLAAVFSVASDPIADHGGEIYQYVGDEMVVTWPVSAGRRGARPLACFFAIEAAIEAVAGEFEREFGIVPRLRAALHAGPVIGGEIGDSKREIVFHGAVMNTAARLEQATRDLDRPFLVSAEARGRLDGTEPYAREALGPRALRGREAPVEIYALTAAR